LHSKTVVGSPYAQNELNFILKTPWGLTNGKGEHYKYSPLDQDSKLVKFSIDAVQVKQQTPHCTF
jgi:hypothetical protein